MPFSFHKLVRAETRQRKIDRTRDEKGFRKRNRSWPRDLNQIVLVRLFRGSLLFKWAIRGLYFSFIFAFSTVFSKYVQDTILTMAVFEPQTSGFGSDHSANWAATTVQGSISFHCSIHPFLPLHYFKMKVAAFEVVSLLNCFFKWAIPASLLFIFVFSNKHYNSYNK